jgi:hypothetical protein
MIWVKFDTRTLDTPLLWIRKFFKKKHCTEDHMFITGINDITYTHVSTKHMAFWTKECFGKVFVPHFGVQHLESCFSSITFLCSYSYSEAHNINKVSLDVTQCWDVFCQAVMVKQWQGGGYVLQPTITTLITKTSTNCQDGNPHIALYNTYTAAFICTLWRHFAVQE